MARVSEGGKVAAKAGVAQAPVTQVPPTPVATPGAAELLISNLLRSGVWLSLGLVVGGMVLSVVRHPDYLRSGQAMADLLVPPRPFHSLENVLARAGEVRGQAFVMLGLLVMICTPVLRVAVALATFQQQKDRPFVRITATVLALLAVSLLLGKASE